MLSTIVSIASGGAIGALARHGVNVGAVALLGAGFPWGTMVVNIAGSFVMGILVTLLGHIWQPAEALRLFLITGFLGAFTTFSTFSLDAVTLWQRGEVLSTGLYIAASIIVSITALMAGIILTRSLIV